MHKLVLGFLVVSALLSGGTIAASDAFFASVARGDLDFVVKGGFDVTAKDLLARNALHVAVQEINDGEKMVAMVQALIAAGVPVDTYYLYQNFSPDLATGYTPLHLALELGIPEVQDAKLSVVQALLTAGADINLKNFMGCDALFLARRTGPDFLVKLLTDHQDALAGAGSAGLAHDAV